MESKELFAKVKLCGSMAIFGSIGIFVKYLTLPSGFLVFLRAAIGLLFLLPFVIFGKSRFNFESIRNNLIPLLLSGVCLGANWILLFEAYKYTGVSVATLCYYLAPVFIVLLSPFILKERLNAQKIIGIALALGGMMLVSGVLSGADVGSLIGVLLGIGAAILYASVVFINKKIKDVSAYDKTISQFAVSMIITLPYTLFTENISGEMFKSPAILLILAVGVIHTGVAYLLYFSSLKDVHAHTAAIFSYIDPVLALILAFVILKERMGALEIIGAILVLGGAFLSEIKLRNTK